MKGIVEAWMRPYRGNPLAFSMDETLIPKAAKASLLFPAASLLMAVLVYWLFRSTLIPQDAPDVIWLMGALVLGIMSGGLRLVYHYIGDRVSPMVWLWISLLMLLGWSLYWALPSVLFLKGVGTEQYWLMGLTLLFWAVVSAELLSVFAIHGLVFNSLLMGSFAANWLLQGPLENWSTLLLPLMLALAFVLPGLLAKRRMTTMMLQLENDHIQRQHRSSVQTRARLLGAVSDDLYQPLQAINLQLEQLPHHLSTARGRELVGLLESSTMNMNILLRSLSDLSKLDRQVIIARPEHIRLGETLQDVLSRYRREAQAKGIRLQVMVHNDVTWVDAHLIGRVMDHILCNSVRYTSAGEIRVTFQENPEGQICLLVEDTGCGIAAADIPRIFDEFEQIKSKDSEAKKGLGLGLSLARRLCEVQGIELELSSEPGTGTRVCLTLQAGDESQLPERPVASVIQSFNSLEVLLIEPDASVRAALSSALGHWGCRVKDAESRWAGLCLLDDGWRPQLVIADNGVDEKPMGLAAVVSVWQALNEEIHAIILASHTGSLDNQTVKDAGIIVLEKPASQSDLRQAIAHLTVSNKSWNQGVTCNDSGFSQGQNTELSSLAVKESVNPKKSDDTTSDLATNPVKEPGVPVVEESQQQLDEADSKKAKGAAAESSAGAEDETIKGKVEA